MSDNNQSSDLIKLRIAEIQAALKLLEFKERNSYSNAVYATAISLVIGFGAFFYNTSESIEQTNRKAVNIGLFFSAAYMLVQAYKGVSNSQEFGYERALLDEILLSQQIIDTKLEDTSGD
jgi:hypothetical protein